MIKKLNILFATDFSPGSRIALKLIKSLEKKIPTRIAVLHVVSSFWENWMTSGLCQKEVMSRLMAWTKKIGNGKYVSRTYVKVGNPADMIIQQAQVRKANLIVMGGRVVESSGRYKTGTTINSVVRSARQSVLVCQKNKISNILCAIDGSATSKKTLQIAIDLAKQLSARLSIIHALPGYQPIFGMTARDIKVKEEKLKKKMIEKMSRFLACFDFGTVKHKVEFRWGAPAHVILDMAEDNNNDLIVIGAKGHSILRHVLLGSTADKVLRYATSSLLVVR